MRSLRVWAPYRERIELVTSDGRREMRKTDDGHFEIEADLPDGARYAFAVEGGDPLPDPRSPSQPDGVHGPSAVFDPTSSEWTDQDWHGRDLATSILYELHVGTFTPQGTFDGVISRLDHLVALGVNAISLMPVGEFPGDHGWGYDGVDLYAAHHAYGGPYGLDRLVDAAHARGIAVVLDVVYNHVGPDGNHLSRFAPYFTDRYRTPWGEAMNYDGPDSPGVRAFAIENALMWLRDHHLDGVRLDAVHAIHDLSAVPMIEELTARVDELEDRLGRTLWVIAESDLNDPKVVRGRDAGGFDCDAQWSDDVHHAIHALLTGERTGYYADFGRLADLAKALRDVYVYDGRYSAYRKRVHGRRFGGLSGHKALAYTQTHDQVGNRPSGDRLSHLVGPERLKIAAAVVLTSPYVPMLFMGEEWGAATPFCYFTDHRDPKLARAVSEGRRHEFSAFGWPPSAVVDPQSAEAFTGSRLDWSEPSRDPHRPLLEWYRALIALRSHEPALTDGRRDAVEIECDEAARWMRITRGPITTAFALDQDAVVPLADRAGDLVLSSDPRIRVSERDVLLPADSVAIVRRRSP